MNTNSNKRVIVVNGVREIGKDTLIDKTCERLKNFMSNKIHCCKLSSVDPIKTFLFSLYQDIYPLKRTEIIDYTMRTDTTRKLLSDIKHAFDINAVSLLNMLLVKKIDTIFRGLEYNVAGLCFVMIREPINIAEFNLLCPYPVENYLFIRENTKNGNIDSDNYDFISKFPYNSVIKIPDYNSDSYNAFVKNFSYDIAKLVSDDISALK